MKVKNCWKTIDRLINGIEFKQNYSQLFLYFSCTYSYSHFSRKCKCFFFSHRAGFPFIFYFIQFQFFCAFARVYILSRLFPDIISFFFFFYIKFKKKKIYYFPYLFHSFYYSEIIFPVNEHTIKLSIITTRKFNATIIL